MMAGDRLLLTDTHGKGHTTTLLSDTPVLALMVRLQD
jgi:hypothetical protein